MPGSHRYPHPPTPSRSRDEATGSHCLLHRAQTCEPRPRPMARDIGMYPLRKHGHEHAHLARPLEREHGHVHVHIPASHPGCDSEDGQGGGEECELAIGRAASPTSSFVPRTRWRDLTTVLVLRIPPLDLVRTQDEDGGIPPLSSSPVSLSHDTKAPTTPVGTLTRTNHGCAARCRRA